MAMIGPRELLIVDDSEEDVALLKRAFAKTQTKIPVVRFPDARKAIGHLQNSLQSRNRDSSCLPQAIITDLKMPMVDGFEFLTWIRAQPLLNEVLVIVLTG